MHVSAALVVLIYIPLSVPVKLFLWAFVKPFRKENLRGKVVLITGASSGIGEELAYQYAGKGACLALLARRKQALEGVAAAARERGAPDVLVLPADVSDADESRRAVEETVAHFGKLNHLVANAGIWSTCFFDEVTNITAMMDVNGANKMFKSQVQIGVFPVGRVETFCKIALDSIRKGDWYVTWPSLYRPLQLVACLAPEVMNWMSYTLYNTSKGSRPLGQRMLEATGARRLYPSSLRHPGRGIKIQDGGKRQ